MGGRSAFGQAIIVGGLAVGLIVVGGGAVTGQATTVKPLNIEQMSQAATDIIVGKVVSVDSRPDAEGVPATFYTIDVKSAVKGAVQGGQSMTVKQLGFAERDPGAGQVFYPFGMPKYEAGGVYLLFLHGKSSRGFRSPTGLGQGAFRITADGQVLNMVGNRGLFKGVTIPTGGLVSTTDQRIIKKHKSGKLSVRTILSVVGELLGQSPASVKSAVRNTTKIEQSVASQAGPLSVSGGEPVPWDIDSAINSGASISAIPYNPDGDTSNPVLGALTKSEADALISDAFSKWGNVSSSTATFSDEGDLSVDVDSNNVGDWIGDGSDGKNPAVYDVDGSLTASFIGTGAECFVLGFAGPDAFAASPDGDFNEIITEASTALNGLWVDNGQFSAPNCQGNPEISNEAFKGVFVHEFGHYFGLDHTQVNGHLTASFTGGSGEAVLPGTIGVPPLESTNSMFPFTIGHDSTTLEFDDKVSVSRLYPTSGFANQGMIEGQILDTDGTTSFDCANAVARRSGDPFQTATSHPSGTLSPGRFQLKGLPDGDYYVEVEAIEPDFTSGSSVGPCDPPAPLPAPEEFFNGSSESTDFFADDPSDTTLVTINGSNTASNTDILLNAPPNCEGSVDEDFESGDLSSLPWSTGGDANWSVVSGTSASGSHSAVAPDTLGNSETSFLEVEMDVEDGAVCFQRRVSSEADFDFLRFFIDGKLTQDWSGVRSFSQVKFAVEGGTHTFRWEYSKDRSISDNADQAWIDDVDFPLAQTSVSCSSTDAVFRVIRTSGDVCFDGSMNAGGADLAEHISVSESVEPGDVVAIDPQASERYRKTRRAHSELAAGVIASDPGVVLGANATTSPSPVLDLSLPTWISSTVTISSSVNFTLTGLVPRLDAQPLSTQPVMALMGQVPVKATTANGPIEPGDLLVSASKPGYAMRCDTMTACEGAIVGKALEALDEGQGTIRMLVIQ